MPKISSDTRHMGSWNMKWRRRRADNFLYEKEQRKKRSAYYIFKKGNMNIPKFTNKDMSLIHAYKVYGNPHMKWGELNTLNSILDLGSSVFHGLIPPHMVHLHPTSRGSQVNVAP